MLEHKVRIGLIGTGQLAAIHETGYTEIDDLCELVAFCDLDLELAQARAKPHHARVYMAYQDLLADPEVEIVDITVPNHLHHTIALEALQAGKHVLFPTPLSMSSLHA